ncbi:MAG: MlaD family protein [Spirochaetota bacterium]
MSYLARIGLFFLVIGVSTVGYVLLTVDNIAGGNTYTITVVMEDASGLIADAAVEMAGVEVGQIDSIDLEEGKARLTLRIREDVQIYEDANINKKPSSLLGTSVVSIDPGQRTGAPVEHGQTVQSVQSGADISSALGSMEDVGTEATLFIRELREQFATEETYGSVSEIVENLRATSESTRRLLEQNLELLSGTLNSIDEVVGQVNSRSDQELERISRILESTAAVATRLEELMGGNDEQIARSLEDVQASLASLNRTLQSVESSAENVNDATTHIRSGEGTLGKVVYDDELYNRVNTIADDAEQIVDRVAGLGVQVGYEGAYLTNAEAARNDFHLRLLPGMDEQSQTNPRKYYELGIVDTPGGVTERTTEEVTTTESGSEETYTEETETTVDTPKFTALLARRWGPLTLRGGLIENSGGVGVDITPLDQLQLSAEMFRFSNGTPNLRTYGTLYPFYDPQKDNPIAWLFLSGGVEDTLSEDRDYFFGGGVRFTDQDLQGLVGLVPFGAAQ